MNPLLLAPLLQFGRTILDKFIPDEQEKQKAEFELIRMAAEGDLQVVLSQLEINAREAQNPSVFVSGGRPAVIWICAAGFAWATLIQPMLAWLAVVKGWPIPPEMNLDILTTTLYGLLGLSITRTFEKVKGIATK